MLSNRFFSSLLVVLYGQPDTGKSFIAMCLGWCVAAGLSWLGRFLVNQGVVVYIAAEGQDGLKSRVTAWRRCQHETPDLAGWRCSPSSVNLLDDGDVTRFIDDVKDDLSEDHVALVIVDTLARCMPGGDENSTKDMGKVIANADRMRESLKCAVLIVHHTGKDGGDARGSSSLRGAADVMLKCSREGNKIRLRCDKMKDGEEPDPIHLRLNVVELDDEGAETSCVVEPVDGEPDTDPHAAVLLETLFQLMKGNPSGVSRSDWRNAVGLVGIKKSTFDRALDVLVLRNAVKKSGSGQRVRCSPAAIYANVA